MARSRERRSTAADTVVAGRCGAESGYGRGLGAPPPSPRYQFSPSPVIAWPKAAAPVGTSWCRLTKAAPRAA